MSAHIRAHDITLDVPTFLQRERNGAGWKDIFFGAAFDPPKRQLVRLLDSISFEVNEGDKLAILGRNGAGKSTLLRVLNRVYQPTSGRLEIAGSHQALLNIGLGFNGQATVRENIYLRGIAMGLKSAFLATHVASILEFAGLQDKINHRLYTLSAGQRMRLGFAISTSVQHDIMLMDEWVGAGDSEFMARAKERMQGRVGGSKIVVLASHSFGLLEGICNKGIVLERGRLIHIGDIASALKAYHALMEQLRSSPDQDLRPEAAAARVYGRVAKLIEWNDDCLVLEGWCADSEGGFPAGLVMDVQGMHFPAVDVTRIKRPDVMRRFGLMSDDVGFRVTFKLPATLESKSISSVNVLASSLAGRLGTALQMAPDVLEHLRQRASSSQPRPE